MSEWAYTIQLKDSVRLYWDREKGEYQKSGIAWYLSRTKPQKGKKDFTQSIVASPEVFDCDEDAKKDALEKLSVLRCPIEQPIDRTIKWIVSG